MTSVGSAVTRRVLWLAVAALLLTGCTSSGSMFPAQSLESRCRATPGMEWVEKRGEAGTIIGYECRRLR